MTSGHTGGPESIIPSDPGALILRKGLAFSKTPASERYWCAKGLRDLSKGFLFARPSFCLL